MQPVAPCEFDFSFEEQEDGTSTVTEWKGMVSLFTSLTATERGM